MVYRCVWGVGEVEGQDVCLPMSHDSERKRRGEWDERREEGDGRRREGEHLHVEEESCLNKIMTDILYVIIISVNSAAVNVCMYAFLEETNTIHERK